MEFKGLKQFNRVDVINDLITEHNLKSYLQIGETHLTGSQIKIDNKTGVDWLRNNDGTYNEFYKGYPKDFYKMKKQFDIIFIDGEHNLDKLHIDYEYALQHSKFIVFHDVLPLEEESTKWPNNTINGAYHGDVYKVLMAYYYSNCPYTLYNFDQGVLVINVNDGDTNNREENNNWLNNYDFNTYKETEFNYTEFVPYEFKAVENNIEYIETIKFQVSDEHKALIDMVNNKEVQQLVKEFEEKSAENNNEPSKVVKKRKPMSEATKAKIAESIKNKKKK